MITFNVLDQPYYCRTKDQLRFQEMSIAIDLLAHGKTMEELETIFLILLYRTDVLRQ